MQVHGESHTHRGGAMNAGFYGLRLAGKKKKAPASGHRQDERRGHRGPGAATSAVRASGATRGQESRTLKA